MRQTTLPETEPQVFKNLLDVVDYLDSVGFKVSKSTVYRHRTEGRIQPAEDGSFSVTVVNKYARGFLNKKNGSSAGPVKTISPAADDKQSAEARKVAAQAEHWEIKTKILRGEYVERDIHESALAMRASRLKSDAENDFRNKASEAIRLVDGDMVKLPDMIDWLLNLLEDWLDRYSEDVEFDLPASVDLERLERIEN